MNQKARPNTTIIWQEIKGEGITQPEPLLAIAPVLDVIEIQQEKRWINLNYDSIDEFIETLKKLKSQRPS